MGSIESKVKEIIIEKLGVEEWEVTMNADFVNDLGADSLDAVEIIMEIEKEFGITIPDDVAERVRTVGNVVKLLGGTGDGLNSSGSSKRKPSSSQKLTNNNADNEQEYLAFYSEMLEDYGTIGPRERKQLVREAERLGISQKRASEIESFV